MLAAVHIIVAPRWDFTLFRRNGVATSASRKADTAFTVVGSEEFGLNDAGDRSYHRGLTMPAAVRIIAAPRSEEYCDGNDVLSAKAQCSALPIADCEKRCQSSTTCRFMSYGVYPGGLTCAHLVMALYSYGPI